MLSLLRRPGIDEVVSAAVLWFAGGGRTWGQKVKSWATNWAHMGQGAEIRPGGQRRGDWSRLVAFRLCMRFKEHWAC